MSDCTHDYKLDFKSSIYICAHCGKGRMTDPVPVGSTPADAKVLRRANHALAIENHELQEKVRYLQCVARQALEALENHATGRTLAGGVYVTNAAIALREQLGDTK